MRNEFEPRANAGNAGSGSKGGLKMENSGWNRAFSFLLAVASLLVLPCPGQGAYPERPITMICPYAGGEYALRPFTNYVEKALGQPVIIQTKAGASATLACGTLAAARPDGYTLGQITFGPLTMGPHLYNVAYDPFNSFEFIMGYGKWEYGPCVRLDSAFKTLKDLVTYAKAHPGEIKYSTVGLATPTHFGMVHLAKAEGIKWEVVVFKEVQGAITAGLGGHVQVVSQTTGTMMPYIKAGQARLLASFSDVRSKWAPEIPTARELGYPFDVVSWLSFGAPKGVPKEIMEKLRHVFNKAMQDPEVLALMDKIFVSLVYRTPEEFKKLVEIGYGENEKVIRALGLHKSQKK
jgi:tripartite-type tricarboxylate transporter receptor subunit TctC